MPAKRSLVDEIAAAIPRHHTTLPWWQKLTPEQTAELQPILAAWKAGVFGTRRRTASRVISIALQSVGITIGEQGVDNWLKRAS